MKKSLFGVVLIEFQNSDRLIVAGRHVGGDAIYIGHVTKLIASREYGFVIGEVLPESLTVKSIKSYGREINSIEAGDTAAIEFSGNSYGLIAEGDNLTLLE